MKNFIGFAVFVICILTSSASFACDRCGHHHYSDREVVRDIGQVAAKALVNNLFGSQQRHYNSHYNNYSRYNEVEMARREGYERARQQHLERMRWEQEQAEQRRIESARMEGEMMYNQRYGRRY